MPEQNCSKHTEMVTVEIADRNQFKKKRRIDVTAAQLRVLAEYTDGFCAVEFAVDAALDTDAGMQFWFTTESKQDAFRNRVRLYLNREITDALRIS